MIMRIYHPDRGHIRVLGEERMGAANDRVGYLPEERGLYKQMKVRDVLRFYAELKGCRDSKPLIDRWLERLGLAEWADKKVATLSKGMSQKVQFIATVVSRPALVLLDEPFSGLDPVNAVVLRDAVLDLKKEGITVIFSTHDMAVAEKMCDFLFMIYKGQKVLDGTLAAIQAAYGSDTLKVRLAEDGVSLDGLPGVARVSDFGKYQELRLDPGAATRPIAEELMRRGSLLHFEMSHPTLQDIFVRIADPDELRGEAVGA
jgi:ABC-2 type transport system ATP-binding protein